MKAFPHMAKVHMLDGNSIVKEEITSGGMDLRDYFASNAPIFIDEAQESLSLSTKTTFTEKYDYEVFFELARLSYFYADAMMQARNDNN